LRKKSYPNIATDPLKSIVLVEGQDKTTAYRRLSEPGRKTKLVYRAYTEKMTVAGLGLASVTYSLERKNKKGKQSRVRLARYLSAMTCTAFARFVSITLLSFMFLEGKRFSDMEKTKSKHKRAVIAKA
jgi:hypothetical protein